MPTQLHKLVYDGDYAAIKNFFKKNKTYPQKLLELVNQPAILSINIIQKNEMKFPYSAGDLPLFIAIKKGSKSIVDLLLEEGADPNLIATSGHHRGWNSFAIASALGNMDMVETLLPKVRILEPLDFSNSEKVMLYLTKNYEPIALGSEFVYELNASIIKHLPPGFIGYKFNLPNTFDAIGLAAIFNNLDALKIMLTMTQVMDPKKVQFSLRNALAEVIKLNLLNDKIVDAIDLLIDYGAQLNKTDEWEVPLHLAIKYNNLTAIKHLITRGADVNFKVNYGPYKNLTPLFHASNVGSLTIVTILLENNADPNCVIEEYYQSNTLKSPLTALMIAAEKGSLDIVIKLLMKGADPLYCISAQVPEKGLSALTLAAQFNHLDVARVLLGRINTATNDMQKVEHVLKFSLILAASNACNDIVNFLTPKFIDPNAALDFAQENLLGVTPLFAASVTNENLSVVETLLKAQASPNMTITFGVYKGANALWSACYHNARDIVLTLLEAGADPYLANHDLSYNPFFEVIKRNNVTLLKDLLTASHAKPQGISLFSLALLLQSDCCLELLLESGADCSTIIPPSFIPEVTFIADFTPLYLATEFQDLSLIYLLLKFKSSVNAAIETGIAAGSTPLLKAIDLGHTIIISLLLNEGANPDYMSDRGVFAGYNAWGLALEKANAQSYYSLLTLLTHYYSEVDELLRFKDRLIKGKLTPLFAAILLESPGLIKLLLKVGANPLATISFGYYEGESPYVAAAYTGNEEIFSLFLNYNLSWTKPIQSKRISGLTLKQLLETKMTNPEFLTKLNKYSYAAALSGYPRYWYSHNSKSDTLQETASKEAVMLPENVVSNSYSINLSYMISKAITKQNKTSKYARYLIFAKNYLQITYDTYHQIKNEPNLILINNNIKRSLKKLLFKFFHALWQYAYQTKDGYILNESTCNELRNLLMHNNYLLDVSLMTDLIQCIDSNNLTKKINQKIKSDISQIKISYYNLSFATKNKLNYQPQEGLEFSEWMNGYKNLLKSSDINILRYNYFKNGIEDLNCDIYPIDSEEKIKFYTDNIIAATQTIVEFGEIYQQLTAEFNEIIKKMYDDAEITEYHAKDLLVFFQRCKDVRDVVAHEFINIDNEDHFDQIDPIAIANLAKFATQESSNILTIASHCLHVTNSLLPVTVQHSF